jgi:hypothetical protein
MKYNLVLAQWTEKNMSLILYLRIRTLRYTSCLDVLIDGTSFLLFWDHCSPIRILGLLIDYRALIADLLSIHYTIMLEFVSLIFIECKQFYLHVTYYEGIHSDDRQLFCVACLRFVIFFSWVSIETENSFFTGHNYYRLIVNNLWLLLQLIRCEIICAVGPESIKDNLEQAVIVWWI